MKTGPFAGAFALLATLTVLGTFAGAGTTAAGARTTMGATPATHYYLALGDSLSVGFQPDTTGLGQETNQGYANDLYALARKKIANLKLVELGCPGETTQSMISGTGNPAAAVYHCDRRGGSQLAAALAFLRTHSAKGEVPLVTIDIGANDVDGCTGAAAGGLGPVETCVEQGVTRLEANTPKILAALHKAAPAGTFLAAMNLYDPILAGALSTDPAQQSLATLSIALVKSINTAIAKSDRAHGFVTADVATAFHTADQTPEPTAGTPLAATGMSTVPTDVANICGLTWMCAPAPQGPNIHANAAGYTTIAGAFTAVLPQRF